MDDKLRYERIYKNNKYSIQKNNLLELYTKFLYKKYVKIIINYSSNLKYLDLASGEANNNEKIINHFKSVIFSEISDSAIRNMNKKFKNDSKIQVIKVDLEKFSFKEKFDLITVSSSLSYVDIELFLKNLNKSLNNNGKFIFLDTLNTNLIYKFYRFILIFVRPNYRSKKVMNQLLTNETLNKIKLNFNNANFIYCGNSIIFIFLLNKLIPFKFKSTKNIDKLFSFCDKLFYFFPPFKVIGICE